MAENEVEVRLRAQISDLTDKLDEAKSKISEFSESGGASFSELAKQAAEVFGLMEAKNFIKESISAFADYQRSLSQIGISLQNVGKSFPKKEVDDFLEGLESTSLFSKTQLAQSLDTLVFKVGDLKTAMGLEQEAANLAMRSHQDLGKITNDLTLLYEGFPRGIQAVTKDLGLAQDKTRTTSELFAILAEKTKDTWKNMDETTKALHKSETAWENLKLQVGEFMAPLAQIGSFTVSTIKSIASLAVDWETIIFDLFAVTYQAIEFQAKTLVGLMTHPIDTLRGLGRSFKAEFGADIDVVKEQFKNMASDMESNWTKPMQEKVLGPIIPKIKQIGDEYDRMLLDVGDETQQVSAEAQTLGKNMEEATKKTIEAGAKGKDAMKSMGDSVKETGKEAIASLLQGWASYWFAQSAAAFIGENYLSGVLDAAAGAVLEGAIGGIMALATGGIVTSPTLALVGEAGPEAVIPLDKFGDTMQENHFHMAFPGVTKASEGKEAGRLAAREIISALDENYRRSGRRAFAV